ncbi:2-aminomuconic semialdehyde dehydrogenase isoform X6 [Rhipicephalus sanguineus]|uniref:2-aminomuconic semialdehyde dehydrogenase isoform X6 n=1 Tax=Rhipicephalus sanguineus TaxID=34632 RepID=UPI0020C51C2C|nr:2-aminomuconic semialdehyde dehydrogenase isoform X6 [Rhipicephalus sanguineus]
MLPRFVAMNGNARERSHSPARASMSPPVRRMLVLENFINGKFESLPETIENVDPSTGIVYSRLPNSGSREVDKAVHAAMQAFPMWSTKSPGERSKFLIRIADLIESRVDEFSQAASRDQGMPVWLARTLDIPRAVHNFRHFATTAQCDREMAIPQQQSNMLYYTVRSAVGVVAVIVPWNLPLYLLTFQLASAMVYGNTVVAKPSELTSVTAWMLAKVFVDAGLPPGVVNFVFGFGQIVGDALVRHPNTKAISFTGSTKTGTTIAQVAAPHAKKLSLEMGGKNAAIVFEDADIKKCIATLIKASFLNQGELCLCTSRIYVHKKIYQKFTDTFVQETRKLKVGPPQSESVFMGALVSKEHLEKVKFYIKLAMQDGGKVLCGGLGEEPKLPKENKNGYFLLPTVITDLPHASRCIQEEIFGPVTCLTAFDTDHEVVEKVNGVAYGLCASIWSKDVCRIHKMAQHLEVGTIWCNCWMVRHLHMPFGGMKMSGVGREGTDASKEFYTEVKSVCLDYS